MINPKPDEIEQAYEFLGLKREYLKRYLIAYLDSLKNEPANKRFLTYNAAKVLEKSMDAVVVAFAQTQVADITALSSMEPLSLAGFAESQAGNPARPIPIFDYQLIQAIRRSPDEWKSIDVLGLQPADFVEILRTPNLGMQGFANILVFRALAVMTDRFSKGVNPDAIRPADKVEPQQDPATFAIEKRRLLHRASRHCDERPGFKAELEALVKRYD